MRPTIAAVIMFVLVFAALGSVTEPPAVRAQGEAVLAAPVPGTVIVDDRSEGFRAKGSGWRSAGGGYEDHHYWTKAGRKVTSLGIWSTAIEDPGYYRVAAKLPRWHASTRKAVYRIRTAEGWVQRLRNQYRGRGGWVNLGTHDFGDTAEVRLANKTLDPRGSRRTVAYDAIRFVPVDQRR